MKDKQLPLFSKPRGVKTPANCWKCPVNWDCKVIKNCPLWQKYKSPEAIEDYEKRSKNRFAWFTNNDDDEFSEDVGESIDSMMGDGQF